MHYRQQSIASGKCWERLCYSCRALDLECRNVVQQFGGAETLSDTVVWLPLSQRMKAADRKNGTKLASTGQTSMRMAREATSAPASPPSERR